MPGFRIHREGYQTIVMAFIVLSGLNAMLFYHSGSFGLKIIFLSTSLVFFGWIVTFFRSPQRHIHPDDRLVYSSADGKVVAIEKVEDVRYFHQPVYQVSVFMSIYNVHKNWYPVSGVVRQVTYSPGQHLVAFHPKSSMLNENVSVVIRHLSTGQEVMVRQIAGAVTRRIVTDAKEGTAIRQGDEMGFIKFGSRVDLFLPEDVHINVHLGEQVYGCKTVIATMSFPTEKIKG